RTLLMEWIVPRAVLPAMGRRGDVRPHFWMPLGCDRLAKHLPRNRVQLQLELANELQQRSKLHMEQRRLCGEDLLTVPHRCVLRSGHEVDNFEWYNLGRSNLRWMPGGRRCCADQWFRDHDRAVRPTSKRLHCHD